MTLLRDLLPGAAVVPGLATVPVTGLKLDSRAVEAGDLFFAIPGAKSDGARFAAQAVERGAVAIVSQRALPGLDTRVPTLVVPDVRIALAEAASRFFPEQPGTIAAVTGTSGKTSVAAFVRQIWATLGHAAASLGTVGLVTPRGETKGELTTPDTITLHETLDRIARDGVTHLVIEASSHGLDQHRLDGLRLAAGGFTNLSRDHMDYHATVEDYLAAKLRLFTERLPAGAPAVVNVDTEAGLKVAAVAQGRGLAVLSVGRAGEALRLLEAEPDGFTTRLTLLHRGRTHSRRLPLAGLFQVENALVAAGLCMATGGDPEAVLAALEGLVGASGRLDRVGTTPEGATVFVDYAHKPDALEKVLETLRPYVGGKLVVVLGCGGDRDPGKRPIMGAIAARMADRVIVTDDNPRSEDPAAIRAAILAAAPRASEIGDRAEAIAAAVAELAAGDILVVAGKGHEQGQIIGDTVLPFSDHAIVRAALERHAA
ncbi:UDP-N-acetylmuramoyl-L-alanyl-D-glutamate--2,6-diaminopimelate ligase [Lichenihabitans sp. Uapishka_5]|uniref:UDP-N-acetylmuramoyl-L-alanyl-D-glutamate--2, 6-diaminopimelate ligase n=1 Tax=Lichenihabitans sp. Uapishka_5 TaxID=3037302 RepID=UPI0029E7EC7D|nr:UDP-N-acetylmuramoyl-L-alanyl-D-glutamate--2,6-diaminopimelate ligase [Lichenihabitans sp. Uapishka_5]MDX7952264.1 UDP-N-acetylmuramoyl-L-alanyl-D-glutamate--2,6-diaminopimelate ligase [Lichenihabitans sp. Uapishka_5]